MRDVAESRHRILMLFINMISIFVNQLESVWLMEDKCSMAPGGQGAQGDIQRRDTGQDGELTAQ